MSSDEKFALPQTLLNEISSLKKRLQQILGEVDTVFSTLQSGSTSNVSIERQSLPQLTVERPSIPKRGKNTILGKLEVKSDVKVSKLMVQKFDEFIDDNLAETDSEPNLMLETRPKSKMKKKKSKINKFASEKDEDDESVQQSNTDTDKINRHSPIELIQSNSVSSKNIGSVGNLIPSSSEQLGPESEGGEGQISVTIFNTSTDQTTTYNEQQDEGEDEPSEIPTTSLNSHSNNEEVNSLVVENPFGDNYHLSKTSTQSTSHNQNELEIVVDSGVKSDFDKQMHDDIEPISEEERKRLQNLPRSRRMSRDIKVHPLPPSTQEEEDFLEEISSRNTTMVQKIRKPGLKTIMRKNMFEAKFTSDGSDNSLNKELNGAFVKQFKLQGSSTINRKKTLGSRVNEFKGLHPRSSLITRWEFMMTSKRIQDILL
jgi:hypothetical protein